MRWAGRGPPKIVARLRRKREKSNRRQKKCKVGAKYVCVCNLKLQSKRRLRQESVASWTELRFVEAGMMGRQK